MPALRHLVPQTALLLAGAGLVACASAQSAPPPALTYVWADGVLRRVEGGALGAEAAMQAAGVVLSANDTLAAMGAVVVQRAQPVTLVYGGLTNEILTPAGTVGEALWLAGQQVYAADRVEPPLSAPIQTGMTITIARARQATITVDGRTLTARSQGETVAQALADAGVALAGLDYSLPELGAPLPEDGLIRVIRVREETTVAQTVERPEVIYQAVADQPLDWRQQIEPGADGVTRTYTRIRYEDGVEVARTPEAEFLAQPTSPRVIGYGQRIDIRTVDTPDGSLEYWRSYDVYATSYSPSRSGVPRTARWFGITRSGLPLTRGLIAVDPRYIPLGTRLYVPGYGFALAADTGGGVRGRFIDLGYDDDNYRPWSRRVTIYFLTPAPPPSGIVYVIPSTIP
jgi:uncharacterized protein YabE (DUF348 family)